VDGSDNRVAHRFTGKLLESPLTTGRPKLAPRDEEKPMEAQRND
jgi:hypothetical protein